MIIQVYAFTDIAQALEAAALGVDHIGFVAGDYGLVRGELSFGAARQLAEALRGRATRVALTMATQTDEILRMAEAVGPDIVHVSSDVEAVDIEAMKTLRKRLPKNIALMKAIPVGDESAVTLAERFAAVSDYLLLDTKVSGFPGVGATGRTHDWRISRRIVEAVRRPVILAGGLTAANVSDAIQAVQPWGVDSNTGTNVPGDPLRKDMERIRAFVSAVRGSSRARPGADTHG